MNTHLITKDFERQAIAFPSRVEAALAEIETVEQAKDLLDKAVVMAQYAERLKAGIEVSKPINAGVLKIKAKLGELMPRGKVGAGRGNKNPTPVEYFPPSTISAYRKLADHKDKLDQYIEETDDVPTQTDFIKFATGKYGTKTHTENNSKENEWYTPPKYIILARGVMGFIDLDPASSESAQETVNAEAYFTIADDGLEQDWRGCVWLNPPYSKDLIKRFAEKLVSEIDAQHVTQAIVLVNNATETFWFQALAKSASAICFPSGRIQFIGKSGRKNSPLQGQAFLYFGSRVKRFTKLFANIGFVAQTNGAADELHS